MDIAAEQRAQSAKEMEPEINFCPRCGTKVGLQEKFGKPRAVCPNCGWIYFADPKVAAAVLVEQNNRVLLVRRVQRTVSWTMDFACRFRRRG